MYKKLVSGKIRFKKNGRNNQGRITIRRRGGGHKRLYRFVNFKPSYTVAKIIRIEYDPFRNSSIALIFDLYSKKLDYILLTEDKQVGDIIFNKNTISLKHGNRLPLWNIPLGFLVHNVELKNNKGSQLSRAAGTYCKILKKDLEKNLVLLKLPSKEERFVPADCFATIGSTSNAHLKYIKKAKAGQSRWRGIRPHVRGVAMNPVDHPHGGGEGKTSGGRPSVSLWGWITKGKSTSKLKNKFIVKNRKQF